MSRKSSQSSITTAVIPVAGLGKRIMPLTLHQPKAMVSIVDRPMVHYVIDEAVHAGARHIILVVGKDQYHFRQYLELLGKDPDWKNLRFDTVVQTKPLGDGHAVFMTRKLIGNRPFLTLFGDDLILPRTGSQPPLAPLINFFEKVREPIIALETVPWAKVSRYGVVGGSPISSRSSLYRISKFVEKPSRKIAPSNLAVVGRYVITPRIMEILEEIINTKKISAKRECRLADAFTRHLESGGALYGWRLPQESPDF